jgi:cyclophilin family peptidyl-prolyl cis-trans isomerase
MNAFRSLFIFFLAIASYASANNPVVVLYTNFGEIKIELYPDKAPVSVDNFLTYVKDGFYKDTIFHRVINGFMIQGGGLTKELVVKPTRNAIKNEADNGLKNMRGSVAMARTNAVDSASSQFFINTVNNDFLNHRGPFPSMYGYCVFGQVVAGMDIVDRIALVQTGTNGGFQDVPLAPVMIEGAAVLPTALAAAE